jgi:S-adenosylmethionine:tRNA ribosyltransferase-isomerase
VVRALEGAGGAAAGETDLQIDASYRLRVVDGLLTGMHEPTASHFRLLQAFAPAALVRDAYAFAVAHGYLGHEFGDSSLILAS